MYFHFYMNQTAGFYERSFVDDPPDLTMFRLALAAQPTSKEFSAIIGLAALYPLSHKMNVTIELAGQMESSTTLAHAWKQLSEGVSLTPIMHLGITAELTRPNMRLAVPELYLDSYLLTETSFSAYAAEMGVSTRVFKRKFRSAFAGRTIVPEYADPLSLAEHFLHRN